MAAEPASYWPQTRRDYPANVYWGDTHVHTNLSNDAFAMGDQVLSPDHAYRFAKGEAVRAHSGMMAKLRRPLDFLVVADHAVNLGAMARLHAGDPLLLETERGQALLKRFRETFEDMRTVLNAPFETYQEHRQTVFNDPEKRQLWAHFSNPRIENPAFRRSVWDEVIANAERHNDPGKFTAFIGYEWTAFAGGAFHRNVVFKDGGDAASRVLPFSRHDSSDPEKLWAYLADYARMTGGDAIAIPHNPGFPIWKSHLQIRRHRLTL
jgi:hypothetical protein